MRANLFERGRIYKHPVQKLWSTYMISNILNNDVYRGNLRTHKKKTVSIRGRAVKLPEEEHFVFENHHEAIISKETFKLAQLIHLKEFLKFTKEQYMEEIEKIEIANKTTNPINQKEKI